MNPSAIKPETQPTVTFDWGLIKQLVGKDDLESKSLSVIQVVVFPGCGHERHNHPEADELLYILSGQGEQMVDDDEPFPVGPGQAVLVPKGVWHSTFNTGWDPMTVLAIYAPGGPEEVFPSLPSFRELPAGSLPVLKVDEG